MQPASEKCGYLEELSCKKDSLKENRFCFNQNQGNDSCIRFVNKEHEAIKMHGVFTSWKYSAFRRCSDRLASDTAQANLWAFSELSFPAIDHVDGTEWLSFLQW